jgi:Zn-dependent protease
MHLFIFQLFENPALYFMTILAFMYSIHFHEFGHATVSRWLGNGPVEKRTLDPFKVMRWPAIACLWLFGFTWAPVPVISDDPNRLRRSAAALAGPFANLLLLLLGALILGGLASLPAILHSGGIVLANYVCIPLLYANAFLFLVNLLPVPGLDGWHAVEPFLPRALVPNPKMKRLLFGGLVCLACLAGASGLFDKGIGWAWEMFTPKAVAAANLLAVGDAYFAASDFESAFNAYSEAAGMGDVEGRFNLGRCHYVGLGTEQDFGQAAEHLRAAADAGHADAMEFLGYENGLMPDYGMPLEEFLRQRWQSRQ